MTRVALWLRIVAIWAAAAALLASAHPARLQPPWTPLAAVPTGLVAGVALFLVAGGLPRRCAAPRIATAFVLTLSAVAEEIVWRWFALGELVPRLGTPTAVAVTSALFALAHRGGFAGRFVTGLFLGSVYGATGSLAAVCCTHVAHNLCVASAARAAPRPAGAAT